MTSAQVLEYRAVDRERIFYSYAEVVQAYGSDVTVYARPFGLEGLGLALWTVLFRCQIQSIAGRLMSWIDLYRSLDCRDGRHAACETCGCTCHKAVVTE